MSKRVEMAALYPYEKGETSEAWTNRVLKHSMEHGVNRQCSIGWHEECSQRAYGKNADCLCICHVKDRWTVIGVWGPDKRPVVAGVIQGRQMVTGGDPEQVWAHWVWAEDVAEAEKEGLAKAEGAPPEKDPERTIKDIGLVPLGGGVYRVTGARRSAVSGRYLRAISDPDPREEEMGG